MSETNTNPEARVVEAVARAIAIAAGHDSWERLPNTPADFVPGETLCCKEDYFIEARAAISAHTKALAAEGKVIEDDWRPIDSAPKSSAHILGFGDGDGVMQCSYVMHWEDAASGIDDWCEVYDGRIVRPTHWRPMPKPPTPTLPPAGDER